MPAALSYPGVYVEEVSSGVRTITGVATSIAAFVGYTRKGVPDKAVRVFGFAQFERDFGGLDRQSPVSYAVNQFFANGGTQAIIVRVASGYASGKWMLKAAAGDVLDVSAANPGAWAADIRLAVEPALRNPDAEFDLVLSERQGPNFREVERHRNLTMDPASSQFVESVLREGSTRIRAERISTLVFDQAGAAVGKAVTFPLAVNGDREIAGIVDGTTPFKFALASTPGTMGDLISDLNQAISDAGHAAQLKCVESDDAGDETKTGAVKLNSLTKGQSSSVLVSGGGFGGLVAALHLGRANGGREFAGHAQHRPADVSGVAPISNGVDGQPAGKAELIGTSAKSGMKALLDIDVFNLLCIPETFDMSDSDAQAIAGIAAPLCESKRAFYIVDAPKDKQLSDIGAWATGATTSANAAVYFPAVRIADPLDGLRLRSMAPSGSIAGVYARTDATRGVWKAPAGIDATLAGVRDFALPMSDIENGDINLKCVNALRSLTTYGRVVWGSRTRQPVGDYTSIPVRRLALFLEESLYRGTQWVVFEPNDEPLWAQIRLNIGSFMHSLFRQHAFQGMTPKDAYFVKCDRETTTQSDINMGIVNIHVGFAPLKPAEFVVLKIQQIAGDIPT